MSQLIRRLIKTAIFPAALMIVSKVAGLILAVSILNLNVYFANDINGIFSFQIYFLNEGETFIANSFSNAFMILVMAVFTMYFVIRYYVSSTAGKNPRTIVKLVKLNLLSWVTSKSNGFIRAFVWTIFFLASSLIVIASSLNTATFAIIGIASFLVLVVNVWLLIRGFEIDSESIYPKENIYA